MRFFNTKWEKKRGFFCHKEPFIPYNDFFYKIKIVAPQNWGVYHKMRVFFFPQNEFFSTQNRFVPTEWIFGSPKPGFWHKISVFPINSWISWSIWGRLPKIPVFCPKPEMGWIWGGRARNGGFFGGGEGAWAAARRNWVFLGLFWANRRRRMQISGRCGGLPETAAFRGKTDRRPPPSASVGRCDGQFLWVDLTVPFLPNSLWVDVMVNSIG